MSINKNKVLVIVGPTASGKTKYSVEIAKKINGEIISADSRQIYKNISIATAVPDKKQRKIVKHHFIEELELEEEYNAGKFGIEARNRIEEIFKKDKVPIVVGGSGLYIKSLIDGLFVAEPVSYEIRQKLNNLLEKKGKEYLYNELKKIDPETALKLKPHFFRRVIRALEVYYQTGEKISNLQKCKPEINFKFLQVGLNVERSFLYERINNRVDDMIKKGLIAEIENLYNKGYDYKKYNSLNTVGIKEVFQYLNNELTYNEMIDKIKQNSRRYAKRQMTWFRKDKRINWIFIEKSTKEDSILSNIEIQWGKFVNEK
ncbi:MAG: tRNA (adenosine(37)-N6)-dimethylallyltransferase MiaA [Ignavibacteria bacterium]|nr:tRNA (adenosine(37)-N6)-dimethylallyltransferase MiaA [Ignavibacteria bacterium]